MTRRRPRTSRTTPPRTGTRRPRVSRTRSSRSRRATAARPRPTVRPTTPASGSSAGDPPGRGPAADQCRRGRAFCTDSRRRVMPVRHRPELGRLRSDAAGGRGDRERLQDLGGLGGHGTVAPSPLRIASAAIACAVRSSISVSTRARAPVSAMTRAQRVDPGPVEVGVAEVPVDDRRLRRRRRCRAPWR